MLSKSTVEKQTFKPSRISVPGLECPLCRQRGFKNIQPYKGHSSLFINKTVACCVDCGLTYMYPMPGTDALNAYYNSGTFWGHVTDKTPFDIPTYHYQAKARLDYVRSHVKLPEKISTLDIGAGFGVLESQIIKEWGDRAKCAAVEPDGKAKESLQGMGVKVENGLDDFGSEKFDLIVLSHVLEHMNDPVAYLSALSSHCKPESVIFIEVPNEDFKFKEDLEPHVLFFNSNSLSKILAAAGLEKVDLSVCGNLREKQKDLNKSIAVRMKVLSNLPFRGALKKAKDAFLGKQVVSDPFSVQDDHECAVYGDDRVWIRCLAKVKSK